MDDLEKRIVALENMKITGEKINRNIQVSCYKQLTINLTHYLIAFPLSMENLINYR